MSKDQALAGYDTVKERKKQFKADHPDGRIVVECIKGDEREAQFKAYVFKNLEEQRSGLPLSTGYAQEFKGQGGFANKTSWLENCEESAVGRALDNAGYNNLRCSKEEMEAASRNAEALAESNDAAKSEAKPVLGQPLTPWPNPGRDPKTVPMVGKKFAPAKTIAEALASHGLADLQSYAMYFIGENGGDKNKPETFETATKRMRPDTAMFVRAVLEITRMARAQYDAKQAKKSEPFGDDTDKDRMNIGWVEAASKDQAEIRQAAREKRGAE